MSNKKISSYQKMKARYETKIKSLTDDIITLVEEKDISKVLIVKSKWKIKLDIEKTVWQGSSAESKCAN